MFILLSDSFGTKHSDFDGDYLFIHLLFLDPSMEQAEKWLIQIQIYIVLLCPANKAP